MEKVIGIRVDLGDENVAGFIAWGAMLDDDDLLGSLTMPLLQRFGIHAESAVGRRCLLGDLQHAPYFFEGLLQFAWSQIPKEPEMTRSGALSPASRLDLGDPYLVGRELPLLEWETKFRGPS